MISISKSNLTIEVQPKPFICECSQLGQFLFNSDKSLIKLNDFNRAEFLLYDEKGHKYCKYSEGKGGGDVSTVQGIQLMLIQRAVHSFWISNHTIFDALFVSLSIYFYRFRRVKWRSPEEYFDYDLTEQVDVFALGNNMYTLLTGLNPFYDSESETVAKNRVKNGVKGRIDPRYFKERSLAEAKLAEIINRCWAFRPEDRPSIFEVVDFLRDALKQERKESGKHSDQVEDK